MKMNTVISRECRDMTQSLVAAHAPPTTKYIQQNGSYFKNDPHNIQFAQTNCSKLWRKLSRSTFHCDQ